jgi:hypothetical protein
MPILPGLLGSPTLNKLTRRSRLLFHWRARDLSLAPLTGQSPTFSRASAGGAITDRNGGLFVPVHSQPRFQMMDTDGDGILDGAGLLLEYARTNLALWSCDFSQASWAGGADFTQSNVTSLLPGQVGRKMVNLNALAARSRSQAIGTLSAAGDVVFVIVENINADTTDISLFDTTGAAHVCRGTFTWATRSMAIGAGSGTLFAVKLAEVGPNGGPTYLLGAAGLGSAGNTRTLLFYPTGVTQNGKAVIVHHAQLEGGLIYPSSPIVTGAGSVARSTDRLTYPLNLGPLAAGTDDFTFYARFARPTHADASGNIVDLPGILSLGGAQADLRLYFNNSSRILQAVARDGAGVTAIAGPNIPAGAVLEVLAQFKDLTTNPAVATDTGSGLSAYVTNSLAPIASFGTPLIGVGEMNNGAQKLGAPFFSAKIANALLTMDQMRQAF